MLQNVEDYDHVELLRLNFRDVADRVWRTLAPRPWFNADNLRSLLFDPTQETAISGADLKNRKPVQLPPAEDIANYAAKNIGRVRRGTFGMSYNKPRALGVEPGKIRLGW